MLFVTQQQKCCVCKLATLPYVLTQLLQIFTHLKLWVSVAIHNFKFVKIECYKMSVLLGLAQYRVII